MALGGNALIRRGETGDFESQRRNVEQAAAVIAALAELAAEIVVTHGNGPQVGFLSLQAEAAASEVPVPPLDVLGAESQGQIGYLLCQALRNAFAARDDAREVAQVLTQTIISAEDPAFRHPTKPIGAVYPSHEAHRLAAERGWSIAPDGLHWRRVVPSPRPIGIVEAAVIRRLVQAGTCVIASGGGGVPVAVDDRQQLRGVEAVIDKDLAAVILAQEVRAEGLLLLTDVDAVYRGWGGESAQRIRHLTVSEAEELLAGGALAAGSMGPKVRACAQFVCAGGAAAIGALDQAEGVWHGRSGTRFVRAAAS